MYPNPQTELIYHTPFQLLVAVMLSAQTTDKQVNIVTKKLWTTIHHPHDIIHQGYEYLKAMIAGVNYSPTKTKHVWMTSELLIKEDFWIPKITSHPDAYKHYQLHGYAIPDTIEILRLLPGVGEKTAKVVGNILYHLPVIAVDTHIHRVSNRLGLCKTKNASQTSKELELLSTQAYASTGLHYHDIHHHMILFGRYHCKANKPQCETCPLSSRCNFSLTSQKHTI